MVTGKYPVQKSQSPAFFSTCFFHSISTTSFCWQMYQNHTVSFKMSLFSGVMFHQHLSTPATWIHQLSAMKGYYVSCLGNPTLSFCIVRLNILISRSWNRRQHSSYSYNLNVSCHSHSCYVFLFSVVYIPALKALWTVSAV